jgi:hypothetical protein
MNLNDLNRNISQSMEEREKKLFAGPAESSLYRFFDTEVLEVMVTAILLKNILEFCSGVCYAKGALEIGLGIQRKVFGVMSFY